MALSRNEVQKNSNARRGIKPKTLKLPVAICELCEHIAAQTGRSQAQIFTEALDYYEGWLKSRGALSDDGDAGG